MADPELKVNPVVFLLGLLVVMLTTFGLLYHFGLHKSPRAAPTATVR